MTLTTLLSSNAIVRGTLKLSAFGLASAAAIVCASVGYGLLKMLLVGINGGATIRIAELSTHSALTLAFFAFAFISAYAAKKCFW